MIACSQQAGSHNSVIVSVCDQTFNSSSTNVVLSALERGCCETAQIENLRQKSWLSKCAHTLELCVQTFQCVP